MIKAVLFDLDGTLVNSLADLATAGNHALVKLGCPIHRVDDYKYFVGHGLADLARRILPENKRDEDTKAQCLKILLEYYSEHFVDKTYAYEGMPQTIKALNDCGIKVAVASNKAQDMAELVVEKIYGNVFELILGKRESFPVKPDPTMLLYAMEKLNVSPNECVFVGDSGMDMAAAVNAGALPVGVLWGFRTAEELNRNGAKFLANTSSELLNIIKEAK